MTNTAQIRNLLLPGVYNIPGKYNEHQKQYTEIFKTRKSKMALERAVAVRFVGLAREVGEGEATPYDNSPGQVYTYNFTHREIKLAYTITRKAIDDNLYSSQFDDQNLGLVRAFVQAKEIFAADVLNTGNVYNPSIGGDGVALFSAAHPVAGATISNYSTAELNEATLMNTMVQQKSGFRDYAGLRTNITPQKLLVPPQLEAVAARIVYAELRPGTANNDPNVLNRVAGGLKGGYAVNQYFTSQSSWFVKSDCEGLVHFERIPFETDIRSEFQTDNLQVKGYERYSFGFDDWRAVSGSFPT
jgi:phage major head subunit gpT-like protein